MCILTGLGVGMVIVSAMVAIYYNMIIGWALYYLFASFTSELPWEECDPDWGSDCEYIHLILLLISWVHKNKLHQNVIERLACLVIGSKSGGVNPLVMPRTLYWASEGNHSQQHTIPYHHTLILSSVNRSNLINELHCCYRITLSLKWPWVSKSDVKQQFTTTTSRV